jgi:hypothetical protein
MNRQTIFKNFQNLIFFLFSLSEITLKKTGYAFGHLVFKTPPLSIGLFLFISCQNHAPRQVTMAFYHWKTTVSKADWAALDTIKVEKVYLRLFDIDWDETQDFPKPLAEISKSDISAIQSSASAQKLVPTIFITHKTFLQIADYQMDTFVQRVFQKIGFYTEGVGFDEIQFDSDWTAQSRAAYFQFLKKIKTHFPDKKIAATIRLHQIKDRIKMGVPPVERGMLMAYNMGNLEDWATENSILDIATLKAYLKNTAPYPLPLDVALPIFSWGIVFRDGEAVKILPNLTKADLETAIPRLGENPKPYYIQKGANRYELTHNQYFKGIYLYAHDEIRLETSPLSILEEAAAILSQKIENQNLTLAYYHLDSPLLRHFSIADFEKLADYFRTRKFAK